MSKKDEQIEQKLIELEAKVGEDTRVGHQHSDSTGVTYSSNSQSVPAVDVKNELQFFLGLGLIITGVLMLFNHIRVGTGFFQMLGMGGGGFGLLMIPLMVGIGWAFYDSRSKWGWGIISLTCGLIFFSVLSSLIMSFPGVSLLGLIMMLTPLAIGGAMVLKSVGGPKAVKQRIDEGRLIK